VNIDVVADAYMGWSLDYAKRMMRLLELFKPRWLEEAMMFLGSGRGNEAELACFEVIE
jgi:L-alanine-DL-glutamate epimerase-like enolase superfamily enzyme